jgi:hypothetical protein
MRALFVFFGGVRVFIWFLIMQCWKKGWIHLFLLEVAVCCLKPMQSREMFQIIVFVINYDREPMEWVVYSIQLPKSLVELPRCLYHWLSWTLNITLKAYLLQFEVDGSIMLDGLLGNDFFWSLAWKLWKAICTHPFIWSLCSKYWMLFLVQSLCWLLKGTHVFEIF